MPRTGVLLVNLGTPDAPTTPAVRRYLREFLMDPRVIDLPPVRRWALVHILILPFRPRRSAEAYRKVWTDAGSPLLLHGRALAESLGAELGDEVPVELAMRYGNPSIPGALDRLERAGCGRVVAIPLYPQEAESSTGTTVEAVRRHAAGRWDADALRFVGPFFDDAGFLDAVAEAARPTLAEVEPDHVLFSYHGLPERHLERVSGEGGRCLARPDCCAALVEENRRCYAAQCHATTRALAPRLGLPADGVTTAFQSRLGRTPWVRPYTDDVLPALAARGVRRLVVLCPSFVADCLETLEEIGMGAAAAWREAGGERFGLAPCVNADPGFVAALARLARRRGELGEDTVPDRDRTRAAHGSAHPDIKEP